MHHAASQGFSACLFAFPVVLLIHIFGQLFASVFPPEVHTQADDVSPLSRILPVASYAQVVQITVSDSRLTSFVIVKPPQAHHRAILHRTLVLIGCLN